VTSKEIKYLLDQAAITEDYALAMKAVKAFQAKNHWVTDPRWEYKLTNIQPDGSEQLLENARPGTCVLCLKDFPGGTTIRWRSQVNCHTDCWDKWFNKQKGTSA
jgi:hypothetical protein